MYKIKIAKNFCKYRILYTYAHVMWETKYQMMNVSLILRAQYAILSDICVYDIREFFFYNKRFMKHIMDVEYDRRNFSRSHQCSERQIARIYLRCETTWLGRY